MAVDPAWIALAGTVFGGVGLKVVEHWLGRNKIRLDDAQQIRNELRLEITSQREEIAQLEETANKWREEYFKVLEKHINYQATTSVEIENLKRALAESERKIEELTRLVEDYRRRLDNPDST